MGFDEGGKVGLVDFLEFIFLGGEGNDSGKARLSHEDAICSFVVGN